LVCAARCVHANKLPTIEPERKRGARVVVVVVVVVFS